MLTVGSLFSGIGGLDLGLERAGMRVLWQCESDPYCRAVLRKHWPDIPCFEDIRAIYPNAAGQRRCWSGESPSDVEHDRLQPALIRSGSPDVLAGGFPCQPVSLAGARRGVQDARWLWPEYARLIRLLRPRYALMENVPGLLVGGGMAEVLGDLAEVGYDAEWGCVAAADVGAPHLRQRIFIVAYPRSEQRDGRGRVGRSGNHLSQERATSEDSQERDQRLGRTRPSGETTMADSQRDARELRQPSSERQGRPTGGSTTLANPPSLGWGQMVASVFGGASGEGADGAAAYSGVAGGRSWWESEPDVGRVAHGVPSRVDRLRALGNAVVPQVAEVIGRMIVNDAG